MLSRNPGLGLRSGPATCPGLARRSDRRPSLVGNCGREDRRC